ncbi:MAG: APC family permease [Rhodospirillales bacterium]
MRAIGRWDLVGLMINTTIGAGILGLPGRVFALVGSWGLLVCAAGGVLMALVAASFAETGSRFTRTGGVYVYIHEAFGPNAGFLAGWLALASRLLSYAAIANLAVTYSAALLPWVASPLGRGVFISLLTLALAVPVWRGVRVSATTHNVFTLIKIGLLLGFFVCALPALVAHGVPLTKLPPARNWAPALVLMLFALGGLEGAVVSNGEMRHPARDLPFALLVGMACVVAIYGAVLMAAMATVPMLGRSGRPVFDGAMLVLGPAGGVAVVAGGVASMAGVMFVILWGGPRELFAMARAGQMPGALAALDARTHAPHRAVLVHTALAWGLALGSGFFAALSAATLTRLVFYAAIAASSVRLRRRGIFGNGGAAGAAGRHRDRGYRGAAVRCGHPAVEPGGVCGRRIDRFNWVAGAGGAAKVRPGLCPGPVTLGGVLRTTGPVGPRPHFICSESGIGCELVAKSHVSLDRTEDSRRAALTTAAARRRGSRGRSPLVGEAINIQLNDFILLSLS